MRDLIVDLVALLLRFVVAIALVYAFAYDVGGVRTAITQPLVNAVTHAGDGAQTDR